MLQRLFGLQNQNIRIQSEILAGLTVAMTMIPESLSFAILAGLHPLTGLYAAFLMGIITAVFGGRPGMVSGGAGATIIVMISLIAMYGIEYLFAAVVLAGIIQVLVGVLKLGRFVRFIPQPVMYGFLNGLAIVIFFAQIAQFKINIEGVNTWLNGMALYIMIGLTLLTILVVTIFPKITKKVPATLVAIIVTTAVVFFFQVDTRKVMDIAHISGSLPSFHIPSLPFTLETLQIILPFSLVMAGVGLVESLLTLSIVDEITNTKGNSNKESIAQGIANITNGFFGGMGGCAMIAQTLVNLDAGARSRLAAIIGSLTILVIILVGAPIIEQIPLAALVGVMMIVAITTFKWVSFQLVTRMPKADIFVLFLVTIIIVVTHNLALAVLIGVIVSALVFAWDNAIRIRARKSFDPHGNKVYAIYGPLFFGSTTSFIEKFTPLTDTPVIYLDFKESRIVDMSAIETLKKLIDKYQEQNKQILLINVNAESKRLLINSKLFNSNLLENN
ncbi:SulP family inorganic anion transporter [Myroides odoratimimus]|uniref:SulP family inorganic anion transporter n=1 Tax=Myroides odoratimimus TaxID=76832 RepID=UPI001CE02B84|nr:SulP family inorganic anion transporter [Myroides odoratimimus]MCA4805740.1 SulP family inorganic anion transporter [Myroides odoratimimus]MCO7723585.1 SulP family inorganic anion transporter [Myroides odoratimimus]MDM1399641.1 SulP family inorganic anion transporter [Myroides odoratimimus]MDM1453255.1 SulP family inorganic anion transporter [Myroides odoratimimus]MDM1463077.1 SulP family inorganic anion transporter [Myroides odoratimimus]